MRQLSTLLALGLALVLPVAPSLATQDMRVLPTAEAHADWRQWGSGEMRWYGFALYRATLYVAGREPVAAVGNGGDDSPYDSPFALALEYRRDIPGARIVEASVDEMRRLGAADSDLQRWEGEMKRLFPDVRKGDTITGFFLPDRGARFYLGTRALGEIADVDFARRFFALWLDPRTAAPAVRAALLRLPPG
ncbi:MAG TPA: chalcone isomerase family protein [Azospira sp.]|nr:chalcone isomerase family protein [Azospira sp.]HNN44907.1 chalcone isomerase family protein [Azospira sp.]